MRRDRVLLKFPDLNRFRHWIHPPPMTPRTGNVVGFYRTSTKGSLCMAEDDLALARSHFSDPGSVVLLIEMDESGPCNAVFFFWDQGQMYGDLPLMEFRFGMDQLAPRLNQQPIEPAKTVR